MKKEKERKGRGKKKKEMGEIEQCIASKSYVPVIFFFLFFHLCFFFLSNLSKARKKQPPGKNINYD